MQNFKIMFKLNIQHVGHTITLDSQTETQIWVQSNCHFLLFSKFLSGFPSQIRSWIYLFQVIKSLNGNLPELLNSSCSIS